MWENRYALRTKQMKSSAIRDLLTMTERPDFISFAGGLPAPEVFPVAEVSSIVQAILQNNGAQALQYGATEGYFPLRSLIAQRYSGPEIELTADNVLITTGSQQALDLLGKLFIDPGKQVVVENPTYLGALQAWNAYGAQYLTVPADNQGMRVEEIEPHLQTQPAWIYALPNFQNPSGNTLSLARRQRLIELATHYQVPVIEDDPYGELRFSGEPLPPLLHLAATVSTTASELPIIYLGTFSKVLAPGLRVGWMIGPQQVISKLAQAKQGVDLNTATLNQMIAYEMMQSGFLQEHIKHICAQYRTRRDSMLAALTRFFPQAAQWSKPDGGLFIWATLPQGIDSQELLSQAITQKVAFVPGAAFYANGGGKNTMRLNFSNATPERIQEGIARLGRLLHVYAPNIFPLGAKTF